MRMQTKSNFSIIALVLLITCCVTSMAVAAEITKPKPAALQPATSTATPYRPSAPGTIIITIPQSGTILYNGGYQAVQWNSSGVHFPHSSVTLWKDNKPAATIANSVTTGKTSFTVPAGLVAGFYEIRVTNDSDTRVVARQPITVQRPSITFTTPKGGESWAAGSIQTIVWKYTGNPGPVKLTLEDTCNAKAAIPTTQAQIGSGQGWTRLNIPVPACQGSYSIKARSAADNQLIGTSASFKITKPDICTNCPDLSIGPCEIRCFNGGTYSTELCTSSGYRSDFTFMAIPIPTLKNTGATAVTLPAGAKLWTVDGQSPTGSTAPATGLYLSPGAEVAGPNKPHKTMSGLNPGSYKVTFIIDPDNIIKESNESNNIRECSWTVVPAQTGLNADLVITTNTVTPASGSSATEFHNFVTVKNIGNGDSKGFNTMCEPGSSWNRPGLKPGESQSANYAIPNVKLIPPGTHTVTCTITPFFTEANTTNNTSTTTFTITP